MEYTEPGERGAIRLLLGVADVASYVRPGGLIDSRAYQNTVSIYTAPKTFHLLPEELSTRRTSLLEGQDQSAVVIEMTVRSDGEIDHARVYRALVRNQARLTYEGVADYLERGDPALPRLMDEPQLRDQLRLQAEAARRLIALRKRMGALTFSSVEAKPVRRNGEVVDLAVVSRNAARDLIESFMIAANVAVASFLKNHGWPIIERVVDAPRRWDRIQQIARNHGVYLPDAPDPKSLGDFLAARRQADPLGFEDLSLSIVKLLGPGGYVIEYPDGTQTQHFGLALDDYSHSTAPNRRYADLVLQRMVLALIGGEPQPYQRAQLEDIARQCTEREDAARKVERLVRKIAAAQLVAGRVGEIFDAIVTGASGKGVYVRLRRPAVEGKVVSNFTGFDVGERVRVQLQAVDVERGFIDFSGI